MAPNQRFANGCVALALLLAGATNATAQYSVEPPPELLPITVEGKGGFINREGKVVIPPRFDFIHRFTEGLASVRIDGHFGFIDKTGSFVIPPRFDLARWFKDGFAHVMVGGKWGFIDKTGAYTVNPQFESVRWFTDGLAPVQSGKLWGYVDPSGRFVIPPQFDSASDFNDFKDDKARVSKAGRNFVIDREGNETTGHERPDLTPEVRNGKWGYVNKAGSVAIPFSFEAAGVFSEGLAAVLIEDRWGFIDSQGHMVIEPQFENRKPSPQFPVPMPSIWPFSEGFAAVRNDGTWQFIDKTGRALPPRFDKPDSFRGGVANVCGVESCGYIDTTGRVIWPWR